MVNTSRLSAALGLLCVAFTLDAQVVRYKARCLRDLVAAVPGILKSQDQKTGRFGTGIWIVTDQNHMLALATAWSFKDPQNPYYHSPEVLHSVIAAGDALIADADANGQWEFRKKDGSTWGRIYMPWTYSRWIRAFLLIRDAMPPAREKAWSDALRLGYGGISRELQASKTANNIFSHHAMGLYYAGEAFHNAAWMAQAAGCMKRVVAAQSPDGYWMEGGAPVVHYSAIYIEALGLYYAASRDRSVLPALARAATFHTYFTYPDGSQVETFDGRNPYHAGTLAGMVNVGFAFTPEGRTFLAHLLRSPERLNVDVAAPLLTAGEEGPGLPRDPWDSDFTHILGRQEATVVRQGPWYVVVSARTTPVEDITNRWWMDRQNFISVFHDGVGLILGGGNSKVQPDWSTFTVGQAGSFHFVPDPGGRDPDFHPPAGLRYVPTTAKLVMGEPFGVDLDYGTQRFSVRIRLVDRNRLECVWSGVEWTESPAVAHVTILPRYAKPLTSGSGKAEVLSDAPFEWPEGAAGAWIENGDVRISLPPSASVHGPVMPWNPYAKGGRPTPHSGLLIVDLPITPEHKSQQVTVQVLSDRH